MRFEIDVVPGENNVSLRVVAQPGEDVYDCFRIAQEALVEELNDYKRCPYHEKAITYATGL